MTKAVPYNQPTAKADAKVNAAGAGPIIVALGVGIVAIFWPEMFDRIPPGFELQLGLGLGGVIAWVSGYVRRSRT